MTVKDVATYTPGPWTCTPVDNGSYALNASGVGWLQCGRDEAFANADLIAAAPGLLEALKALVQRAEREMVDPIDVGEIQHAKEVIAKAEGR